MHLGGHMLHQMNKQLQNSLGLDRMEVIQDENELRRPLGNIVDEDIDQRCGRGRLSTLKDNHQV